jgi:hypothetical protein
MNRDQLAAELHQRLGYRRLSRAWAKAEILLGLAAAGAGLLLGSFALTGPEPAWALAAGALGLFVLGGYLALAGHRSHLYQSSTEQLVLLIEEIRQKQIVGQAFQPDSSGRQAGKPDLQQSKGSSV